MPTQRLSGDEDVDISPAVQNALGVGGLLVVLFYALIKEHLVTGVSHRRELASKDAQIAANERMYEQRIADEKTQVVLWRAVGETSQAQTAELLEHSRLSVQLLQAIERRAQERQSKGPDS